MSFAAPTGGVVNNGSAVIRQFGSVTNIDQSSQRAVINWNSFSITASETVNFNQPNSSSVTLNRVVGNEASIIEGALNANGQVWILNSNGILFAQGASINTAGLVASTMNITDENFMNANHTFESTGSTASVINMGTIQVTDGGYAVLMAKNVSNEGYIKATKGNVTLASGDKIILNFNGDSLVGITIDQGTLDALVENKGAIIADGGAIYLTTKAANDLLNGVVNNSGVLRAQSLDDITGYIEVFAHGGTATVSGTLDASAPVSGDGGFIETSGLVVNIAEETAITTASANGAGGTWLIDPINVTISTLADLAGTFDGTLWTPTATGSRIQNTTIQNALNNGTSVTITTTGALTELGNITVTAAITKNAGSDATLTLKADNNILIQNDITSTSGALNLILDHGSAGTTTFNSTQGVNLNGGTLDVQKAGVTSTGTLTLNGYVYNATLKAGILTQTSPTSAVDKLSNVIFGSNMALNGTTRVEGNLVLADGITLTLGASRYINFISPTASISTTGTTGTIVMNSGGLNRNVSGQALTIDSGITVSGRGNIYNQSFTNGSLTNNGTIELTTSSGGISHGTFTNNGTLAMSATGQIMTINPTTFTNNGIINLNATSGWILMNATNWSNAGTINVTDGGLVLGGNFTTAGIGTIARTGGTVSLSGVLDNTSAVLDIGSATFGTGGLSSLTSLQFATNRGTILGGRIVSNDGTTLKSTSGPATLSGVTFGSNMTLGNSVGIVNDLNLANGITLSLGTYALYFNSATSSITTPVTATITMNNATASGLIRNVTGQALTIGAGVTINGKGTIKDLNAAINSSLTNNGTINSTTGNITISNGTFTNNGTLTATMGTFTVSPTMFTNNGTMNANTGATFTVSPTTFNNAGTANVSGGTLNLSATSWSNTGMLNVSSGILNLDGGFTTAGIGAITRTGGSVNITGTLDNTGSVLDIGSATFGTGGLSSLSTGTIVGGTILSNDGTVLVSATSTTNTLDSVTLGGTNLTMSGNFGFQNNILLVDGLVINKGNGNWGINSSGVQHIGIAGGSGSATINNAGGWIIAGNGVTGQTFQIDSGVTLQGYGDIRQNFTNNTIINNGNIIFNTAAQSSTLGATNFTNNGTISNQAGAFDIYGTFGNNGTISVSAGTFSVGTGTLANNSSGVVNINGGTMGFNYANTVWNNAGAFNVSSGALKLGGVFSVADLGTIVRTGGAIQMNSGILDNTGNVLDIGDTGVFGVGGLTTLWGGTIKGGTIVGNTLNTVNGRLDNVTIGSNLTLNGGASYKLFIDNDLFLANGITLNTGSNYLQFGSTSTQNITLSAGATAATIAMPSDIALGNFTIGSGVTFDFTCATNRSIGLTGNWINNGTILNQSGSTYLQMDSFINNGTIKVQSGAFGFGSVTPTFVNNGTIDVASGGTFYRNIGFTNTGTISGGGTVVVGTGASKLTNQGTINVGGTGTAGTLAITGDLLFDTVSILTAEFGGTSASQYDKLAVSGAVTLGGTLNSSLISGYAPADGDGIGFITAGSSSGTFAVSNLPSNFSLAYAQTAGEAARLRYTAPVNVTLPEPRFTTTTSTTDTTQTQSTQTALTVSGQIATTLNGNSITSTMPQTQMTQSSMPQTQFMSETGSGALAIQTVDLAGSIDPNAAMDMISMDNNALSSDGKNGPVVRFALGKNSFAHLTEGGIHLPKGLKQEFFVAKRDSAKGKNISMTRSNSSSVQ